MDFWEGSGTPAGPRLIMDKPLTCITTTLPCDYTTAARHGWAQVGCNGKVLSVSCYPVPTEGTAHVHFPL